VVFIQFHIQERLLVNHKGAETLHNVLADERLFRIGIACDAFCCLATELPRKATAGVLTCPMRARRIC
jgi:hypothetical protein